MERIKVLLVEPLKKPRLIEVEHTLENLQKLVGGSIQAVYPWEDPVALVCDDEGKFKGYPPNRMLVDEEGNPYDLICGTFFISGLTADDFGSIPDELAQKYSERFQYPEMVMRRLDGRIIWFRMGSGKEPEMIV